MNISLQGLFIGLVATIGMDVWALIAKHVLRLPTTDWALVGRWVGHMPSGVFAHRPVGEADPIENELAIGWIAHYATGLLYGIAYLYGIVIVLDSVPSLGSALAFGLLTLVFPWFVMQPAMGAGMFARKTPRPGIMRLVNISMHAVFGACLYSGWLLFGS